MKTLLNSLLAISVILLAYNFYITPVQEIKNFELIAKKDTSSWAEAIERAAQRVRQKIRQPKDSLSLSVQDLWGDFELSQHPDFVRVEAKYAKHEHFYLRKATYEAFKKMYQSAQQDGILLKIGSAGRSFTDQKNIWESKWKSRRHIENPLKRAEDILTYSAMPATSRHHWGTDIDLNAKTDSYFQSGEGKKIYEWLKKNAPKFGFYQPYTAKNEQRPYGYNEEKWHWSYMPLAVQFLNFYKKQIRYEHIKGFLGAETAKDLAVIEKYVFGISPECLNYKQ